MLCQHYREGERVKIPGGHTVAMKCAVNHSWNAGQFLTLNPCREFIKSRNLYKTDFDFNLLQMEQQYLDFNNLINISTFMSIVETKDYHDQWTWESLRILKGASYTCRHIKDNDKNISVLFIKSRVIVVTVHSPTRLDPADMVLQRRTGFDPLNYDTNKLFRIIFDVVTNFKWKHRDVGLYEELEYRTKAAKLVFDKP